MKKKICFVIAIPITAQSFLRDHIAALNEMYDIYLVGDIKNVQEVSMLQLKGWHHIDIERNISSWKDLKAVWQAWRYFRKMRFDAVHSVTPKAGVVCALAGKLAGIKHRTHIFTGQVWATEKGIMRYLLKAIDKIIVLCDNHILVDGKSQRAFLIKEGIIHEGQAEVFGKGSISGVNSIRFKPNFEDRILIRKSIGIQDNVMTFIFLGRLNHDKGIGELFDAFNSLVSEVDNTFLLVVGRDEEGYINTLPKYKNIIKGKNFHYYGSTNEPEKVLNAGDVFVLPTYREGFGSSVLEAACIGLPSICSDAYGVQDAFIENETGIKCHVGDAKSLHKCMKYMYEHPEEAKRMGNNSRKRALSDFNGSVLTQYWKEFYKGILS